MMNNFDFVMMMIEETCKSHSTSYHVLCVEDNYGRYLMRAEWVNGAPVVCIMYDDVNRSMEVYREVLDVNDINAINALIAEWQEIEKSF